MLSSLTSNRIVIEKKSGVDVVTVVAEYLDQDSDSEEFRLRVRQALREELGVTPGLELVHAGTLARTEFKAKRIDDRRGKE